MKGTRCTVCRHVSRHEIEDRMIEGEPVLALAKEFGVSEPALRRHRDNGHIASGKLASAEAADLARAESVTDSFLALRNRARSIGEKAEKTRAYRVALLAVREETRLIELQAKIMGLLTHRDHERDQPPFVVSITETWKTDENGDLVPDEIKTISTAEDSSDLDVLDAEYENDDLI